MNTSRWVMAAMAFVLGGSVLLFAEEPAGDSAAPAAAAAADAAADAAPAGDEAAAPAAAADDGAGKKAGKNRQVRLTKPWKELTSLSPEQQAQIAAIHRKAVQEIKQIQQREREQIMALLDEGQKTELQTLMDKAAAERKAKKPVGAGKKQSGGGDATAEEQG